MSSRRSRSLFTRRDLCDTAKFTEVLFALSCRSREEVDEMVEKAVAAVGEHAMSPMDHGFMYAWSFTTSTGTTGRFCGWIRRPSKADPDSRITRPNWGKRGCRARRRREARFRPKGNRSARCCRCRTTRNDRGSGAREPR